jgi:hypothetical protein
MDNIQPTQQKKEQSHFAALFAALFLLGILFLGGTYLFIQSEKASPAITTPVKNTTIEQQKDFHDMDTQIEEVDSNAADFSQVDGEMENL